MGIYSTKIFRENEVKPEDVINGPDVDEIGAELDEIEKAVLGPDGIGGNTDDIEAADLGVVGEPLEEAFNIIYESEYNYNQILRCIGLNELTAYSRGKELVFTEADKNGFFTTIAEWIKRVFAKIAEWLGKVKNKLKASWGIDKKFVEKNKEFITNGYNAMLKDGKKVSVQNFNGLLHGTREQYTAHEDPKAHEEEAIKAVEIVRDGGSFDPNKYADREERSIKRMKVEQYGKSISELPAGLTAYLRGEEAEMDLATDFLKANAVMARMQANTINVVEEYFKSIKNTFNIYLKSVQALRMGIVKDSELDSAVASSMISACEHFMNDIKMDIRIHNIKAAAYIGAVSARMTQDRKLAAMYYKAGKPAKEDPKKEEPKAAEPKTESVGSILFSSMNFV